MTTVAMRELVYKEWMIELSQSGRQRTSVVHKQAAPSSASLFHLHDKIYKALQVSTTSYLGNMRCFRRKSIYSTHTQPLSRNSRERKRRRERETEIEREGGGGNRDRERERDNYKKCCPLELSDKISRCL